jgi:hypothetical protein
MTHPQLSQSSWRVVVTHLVPKLYTINLIANAKNILDISIAVLNCLSDSSHSFVA